MLFPCANLALFISQGANVNAGKRLDTPLHAAARKSSAEIVILLADYGANLKCRNAEFKRALDLAIPNSKVEQALLLREGKGLFCLFPFTFSSLSFPLCRFTVEQYLFLLPETFFLIDLIFSVSSLLILSLYHATQK